MALSWLHYAVKTKHETAFLTFNTAHLDLMQVITTNCYLGIISGKYLPNHARCVIIAKWCPSLCGPDNTRQLAWPLVRAFLYSAQLAHAHRTHCNPPCPLHAKGEGAARLKSSHHPSLCHSPTILSNSGPFKHLTGTGAAAVRPNCRKSRQVHVKIVFYK